MRWLAGIAIIVVSVAALVVGVGFLLPRSLEVEVATTVDRPRAVVFALASNLRAAQRFTPILERDPGATLTLSGPERGEGQTLAWSSAVEAIGSGQMTIVAVKPEEGRVDYTIERVGAPTARATIQVTPIRVEATAGAVNPEQTAPAVDLVWRLAAACGGGFVDIPCRYAALLQRGMIREDLGRGVERLANLARDLPNADFEGLEVTAVEARPVTFAYIEREVVNAPGRVEEELLGAIAAVRTYLAQASLSPAGPPISFATKWTVQEYGFGAGVPFNGAAPLASPPIRVRTMEGGPALKVTHVGPYGARAETYAQFEAYLGAYLYDTEGEPWEVLLRPPAEGTGASRVEIWRRIKPREAAP